MIFFYLIMSGFSKTGLQLNHFNRSLARTEVSIKKIIQLQLPRYLDPYIESIQGRNSLSAIPWAGIVGAE